MLMNFFSALGAFVAHLLTSAVLLVAFLGAYSLSTPYSELKLVREGNTAAAIGIGGAMIGFAIALAQAVRISSSVGETLVWGLVALAIQIAGHFLVRRFLPSLARDIVQGSTAAATALAATAITLGLINAACMTP
jgi:putative membrane protein